MHRWLLAKANVWSFPNTPSEAAGDSVWKVDSKVCECSVPLGLVYIVNTSTLAPFLIDLGICLESFLSICSLLVLSWFLEYKGTTLWLEDLESTGANGSQTAAASSWVPPRSVQFILRIWKRKRLLSSSDIKVPLKEVACVLTLKESSYYREALGSVPSDEGKENDPSS